MNYCVLSGHITGHPTLIVKGEETPVTVFVLNAAATFPPAGKIIVVCRQPLAMVAAKYLSEDEYVVIDGYIRLGEFPWKDGKIASDVHIVASDILRCKGVSLYQLT